MIRGIRTVLGDIEPTGLGVTNSHDHLFFRSPRLAGQELDNAGLAALEARAFAAAGGQTIVHWTPRGLGRHLTDLASISAECKVNIVAATGRHRAEHYPSDAAAETVDRLTEALITDIEHRQCGLIKIGTGYHHLDEFEKVSLMAAAQAHHATGVPIGVHLELGTGGDLVLNVLAGHGVPSESIVLGHVGRNPEISYLLDLADSGAFLCFDGPSRANHRTDWRTPECIDSLIDRGHTHQLLIGGDTTTAAARSVTSGPGMPGLLTRFGNALRKRLGEQAYYALVITNPARAFRARALP